MARGGLPGDGWRCRVLRDRLQILVMALRPGPSSTGKMLQGSSGPPGRRTVFHALGCADIIPSLAARLRPKSVKSPEKAETDHLTTISDSYLQDVEQNKSKCTD